MMAVVSLRLKDREMKRIDELSKMFHKDKRHYFPAMGIEINHRVQ
jgi:predicted transcriptional regulator